MSDKIKQFCNRYQLSADKWKEFDFLPYLIKKKGGDLDEYMSAKLGEGVDVENRLKVLQIVMDLHDKPFELSKYVIHNHWAWKVKMESMAQDQYQIKQKLQTLENTKKHLETELSSSELQKKKCEEQLQGVSRQRQEERQHFQQQIQDLASKLRERIQTNQRICSQHAQKTEQFQQTISSLQKQLSSSMEEIAGLNHRIQALTEEQSTLKTRSTILELENYLHTFEGEVLHGHQAEKEFLKRSIEEYTHREVQYTTLLCRFDPLNKVNDHSYFDGQEHLCLVIRLKNGRSVSGYSESAFMKQQPATKGGLLLSLTDKRVFKHIEGKLAIKYDPYYMIFGNSQLRLKNGYLQLFSNFAINNSHYNSEGENYKVMLGDEDSREVPVEMYEIFQVKFRGQ